MVTEKLITYGTEFRGKTEVRKREYIDSPGKAVLSVSEEGKDG